MKPTEAEIALLTKWVEALESGKYKQGRGQLNASEGFCCVGVLCDVVDPTKWVDSEDWKGKEYEGDALCVPESVARLLPVITTRMDWPWLYGRNDEKKQTFPEIAAYLRETYLS